MSGPTEHIRVVLADDHSLVRDGIKALLQESSFIEVIAEASNGEEALGMVGELNPDLLIVDIRMPVLNGIQTVSKLKETSPDVKALVLSMHDSDEYVLNSVEAGASGYLLKDTSKDEFIKAIQTIVKGEKYFSADISTILVKKYLEKVKTPSSEPDSIPESPQELVSLTRRQKQILELAIGGMSNKEIAEHLGKSIRTVEAHRFSLMKKLEVKNLAELTLKAKELGLIS
ncbi:MAG: response regulator transcription factor [Bacteroidota bacterium]